MILQPAHQINTGFRIHAYRQVKRGFPHRRRRVPGSPRQVKKVSGLQDAFPDDLFWTLCIGIDIAVKRVRPGDAINAPAFFAGNLEDEHVMVVPMWTDRRYFLTAHPGISLNSFVKELLEGFAKVRNRIVKFINGVQRHGRALLELLVEISDMNGRSLQGAPSPLESFGTRLSFNRVGRRRYGAPFL